MKQKMPDVKKNQEVSYGLSRIRGDETYYALDFNDGPRPTD